ncbi:MAG: nitroreductase [Dissulfurispiraceae bacterium]|nr:nitroreductase [Dissulfurispiraceae bacterium]
MLKLSSGGSAMDAIECIKTRMSVRKYKPDPVPADLLKKIISAAQRSPSYKNSQPWEVAIVSGEKKEQLSNILIDLLESGEAPAPDIPEPQSWPQEIDARIQKTFLEKNAKFGVDIYDPDLLKKAKRANFRFYGAPHGLLIFQDRDLPLWSLFDAGLFCQSIMLAAHAEGVGTVPQAFVIDYSAQIRKFIGIPDTKRLVLAISAGFPAPVDPAKLYTTGREPMDAVTRWIE